MGSWGYAALEDDTALDFIGEFSATPGLEILETTLKAALDAGYVDDYIGPRALAAAEIVAAINGSPFQTLDPSVLKWAAEQEAASELKQLAVEVVTNVFKGSELREIWEDSDGLEPWGAALEQLKQRLISR